MAVKRVQSFFLDMMKNVLKLNVVIADQICEYSKKH